MSSHFGPVAKQLTEYIASHSSLPYYARVIRVHHSNPVVDYISDPQQLFPFVMGPESVADLKGKTAWEIFDFIGYKREYVLERLSEGEKFVLILFTGYRTEMKESAEGLQNEPTTPFKTMEEPVLATWDNILELIEKKSPIIADRIKNVLPQLRSTPFNGYEFDIERADSSIYEQVCTFEAFEASSQTSPSMVRAFLRHTMKLMELYSGNGFCYNEKGEEGAKEYLIPRVHVEQLVNRSDFFVLTDDLFPKEENTEVFVDSKDSQSQG
jgi:hypothetical protein